MKHILLALALLFISCGDPDKLMYAVNCDACRVRYSVGDSVVTLRVTTDWHTSVRVADGGLYGMHVDSITGTNAASVFISLGGDMQYVAVCTANDNCDLQYVGQVKLPWWAR